MGGQLQGKMLAVQKLGSSISCSKKKTMRARWRSTANSRRHVFNSLLHHTSSSQLQGEAMPPACGQSMATRCAGGSEENTRQRENVTENTRTAGTPTLKQKHLDGGQHHRHGVYLVLVTVEQLLSVMMPYVGTLVKWSMTMPKRKGERWARKKDKLSQKLSFISKTKMCQNPLEIYL